MNDDVTNMTNWCVNMRPKKTKKLHNEMHIYVIGA